MDKYTKTIKGVLLLLVMISLASLVSSSGVSSPYWYPDKPLELMPGETKIIELNLQNAAGATEDLNFQLKFIQDGEGIARILDDDLLYLVPAGGATNAQVEITIPEDMPIGETRIIEIQSNPLSPDNGGMISLSTGVTTKFQVIVVSETIPEPEVIETPAEETNYLVYILVIAAIVIILYFLMRKKGNKKKRR